MTMREEIEAAAARYPDRRSAIMPALMIAQKEHVICPARCSKTSPRSSASNAFGSMNWRPSTRSSIPNRSAGSTCNSVTSLLHAVRIRGAAGASGNDIGDQEGRDHAGRCVHAFDRRMPRGLRDGPVMQVGDDYHGNLDNAGLDALLESFRAAERVASVERAAAPAPGE